MNRVQIDSPSRMARRPADSSSDHTKAKSLSASRRLPPISTHFRQISSNVNIRQPQTTRAGYSKASKSDTKPRPLHELSEARSSVLPRLTPLDLDKPKQDNGIYKSKYPATTRETRMTEDASKANPEFYSAKSLRGLGKKNEESGSIAESELLQIVLSRLHSQKNHQGVLQEQMAEQASLRNRIIEAQLRSSDLRYGRSLATLTAAAKEKISNNMSALKRRVREKEVKVTSLRHQIQVTKLANDKLKTLTQKCLPSLTDEFSKLSENELIQFLVREKKTLKDAVENEEKRLAELTLQIQLLFENGKSIQVKEPVKTAERFAFWEQMKHKNETLSTKKIDRLAERSCKRDPMDSDHDKSIDDGSESTVLHKPLIQRLKPNFLQKYSKRDSAEFTRQNKKQSDEFFKDRKGSSKQISVQSSSQPIRLPRQEPTTTRRYSKQALTQRSPTLPTNDISLMNSNSQLPPMFSPRVGQAVEATQGLSFKKMSELSIRNSSFQKQGSPMEILENTRVDSSMQLVTTLLPSLVLLPRVGKSSSTPGSNGLTYGSSVLRQDSNNEGVISPTAIKESPNVRLAGDSPLSHLQLTPTTTGPLHDRKLTAQSCTLDSPFGPDLATQNYPQVQTEECPRDKRSPGNTPSDSLQEQTLSNHSPLARSDPSRTSTKQWSGREPPDKHSLLNTPTFEIQLRPPVDNVETQNQLQLMSKERQGLALYQMEKFRKFKPDNPSIEEKMIESSKRSFMEGDNNSSLNYETQRNSGALLARDITPAQTPKDTLRDEAMSQSNLSKYPVKRSCQALKSYVHMQNNKQNDLKTSDGHRQSLKTYPKDDDLLYRRGDGAKEVKQQEQMTSFNELSKMLGGFTKNEKPAKTPTDNQLQNKLSIQKEGNETGRRAPSLVSKRFTLSPTEAEKMMDRNLHSTSAVDLSTISYDSATKRLTSVKAKNNTFRYSGIHIEEENDSESNSTRRDPLIPNELKLPPAPRKYFQQESGEFYMKAEERRDASESRGDGTMPPSNLESVEGMSRPRYSSELKRRPSSLRFISRSNYSGDDDD